MKKIKRPTPATDYLFESIYLKLRDFLTNGQRHSVIAIKFIALFSWLRDIH